MWKNIFHKSVKPTEFIPGRIFISCAAFCDEQLVPTIKNMLATADHPELLTFGICLQDTPENLKNFKLKNHPSIKTIYVNDRESKGCCWARSEIQKLIVDEEYYMQIDSHHRFVKGWDSLSKQWLKDTGSEKPVLTAYLIAFNPLDKKNSWKKDTVPYKLSVPIFYGNDKMRIEPETINNYASFSAPVKAKFMSAHYIFAPMQWVVEVPYDELLYFEGEEDTLSARTYTHGWDMFHPHRAVGYHYYTRESDKKHHDVVEHWHVSHESSLQRMRMVLGMDDDDGSLGNYGLGKVRSLQDYEFFTGINFRYREIKGSPRNTILQQKLWIGENTNFKRVETGKWTEYQNDLPVNYFDEIEHSDSLLLLFDAKRDMFVRIIGDGAYFRVKGEEIYADWVLFSSGKWNNELPTIAKQINQESRKASKLLVTNPGQHIAICTMRTPNTEGWAKYAEWNQRAYAVKHNYTYNFYSDLIVVEEIPHWNKVKILMNHLPEQEFVIWVDSDAIFTDFNKSWEEIIAKAPDKDFWVCNDIGGWTLNTGVMVMRNTPWMSNVLEELWSMEHIPHSKAAEQSSLISLLNNIDPEFKKWHIFDQREFNCHPKKHEEGDFVLHMMGLGGEERKVTFDYWNHRMGVYQ